jgi:predicted Ser/Thr protein kinase
LQATLPVIQSITKSSSSTARKYPKFPKEVSSWPEFLLDAKDSEIPQNVLTEVDIPGAQSLLSQLQFESESDVKTAMGNILSLLNVILKSLNLSQRFSSTVPAQDAFIGLPDNLFVDGHTVVGFVECKVPWSISSSGETWNFVDLWKVELGEEEMQKVRLQHVVEQVYGYLSFNKLRYGILTCYNVSYFLCRPKRGTLLISDPVYCNQRSPTLMQCLYYFTQLVGEDHQSTEISPLSAASDSSHTATDISDDLDSDSDNYSPPSKKIRTSFQLDIPRQLRPRQFVGVGGSGRVFKVGEYAVKCVDIYNNPEGYNMTCNEIRIYETLQHHDLHFIPKYYHHTEKYGFLFLILEFIHGTPVKWKEEKRIKKLVLKYSKTLKQHGVEHLDLRPDNVLLTTSKDIRIIDFGLAKLK